MKRFIAFTLLVMMFGVYGRIEAQFKVSQAAWGASLGAAHGSNDGGDKWVMQYRAFLQQKLFTPMLLGQLGVGFTDLESPGVYSVQTGIVDARLLFSPFSLSNLDPYFFAGLGVTKTFNVSNTDFLALVPFGIGVQTKIARGILLDVNGGYNLSLSDKLDGRVRSSTYLNDLTNQKQDGYYGFTAGLAFTLGSGSDEAEELKQKEKADADARQVKADADAQHAKELAQAEAVRVKQKADADAEAQRVKAASDLAAKNAQDKTDVAAKNAQDKTDVAAQNTKELTDAEARRVKELADAEARRLAEQNERIVLERGKKVVLRGINFEFNKATLTPESGTTLTRAYDALMANPDVQVEISGHTDNVGSQKQNQKLSLQRAQAVRNWLVTKGIASNRMKAVGKGMNEPVTTNDTDEGRAENRRIEFYVQQ